jgi:4a-hydroxytetrahydrobiopterin dehydratase
MVTELAGKTCVPCHGGMPTLAEAEIARLMGQLDGWHLEGGKRISKTFKRKGFVGAVELVNQIVPVAEGEGHHPDLHVAASGRVGVEIWTHAVDGLTENDFILAAKIDQMAAAG